MERYGYCAYCRCKYLKNPRVKKQSYCGKPDCQRARKRRWQRQKMATDPDYRLNQQDCMLRWRQRNPHYWKQYRKCHRAYTAQNRLLQKVRNLNRLSRPLIAKMDPIKTDKSILPGIYYILRKCRQIAKVDAIFQKVLIFPVSCLQPTLIAK